MKIQPNPTFLVQSKKKLIITLLLGLALCNNSSATALTGRVLNVLSGNLVEIMTNGQVHRIHLHGTQLSPDNPSAKRAAKRHLAMMVNGKPVRVDYQRRDRSGVILGTIMMGKIDINQLQILNGLVLFQDAPTLSDTQQKNYQQAENSARKNHSGLWQNVAPNKTNRHIWQR